MTSRLLLLIVSVAATQVQSACPPSWAAYGDHCYLFSPMMWDWETSRTLCINRGGDLASFSTAEERNFTFELIYPLRETFWIGAKRDGAQWTWSDGSTPRPDEDPVRNFRDECPAQCSGDCVQMNHWDGQWTNVGCDWSARAICKRKNDVMDLCDYENGWISWDSHCYKYSQTKRTWADARKECQDGNGDLAVVATQDKWSLLAEIVACKDFGSGVWLGLSDTETKAEFKWVDGTDVGKGNWDNNQPADITTPGSNCVRSLPLTDFRWHVDICDRENEYVCAKQQGTCSEGWTDKGTGYCYLIMGVAEDQRRTWSDAEAFCQSAGSNGHLMIVDNELQQKALIDLIGSLATTDVEKVYIGLSDFLRDNVYVWSNGMTPFYYNEGFAEKLLRRMDCSHINTDLAFYPDAKWIIDYCFLKYAFICQMPIHTVPRTPTDPNGYLCPDGFETNHADGICYQFYDEEKTYNDAKSSCNSGSRLMLVQNATSQSFLTSRLRGRTWIGLEYRGNGNYEWYNQSLLRFENWRMMATGSNTRCTSMMERDYIGEWWDDDCGMRRSYVCTVPATHSTATTPGPTPTAPWHEQCGPGWSFDVYGMACYKLVRDEVTWEEAEISCMMEADGSHLVSIHSMYEQSYIGALVMQQLGWVSFWIGANDIDISAGWKWSDGSAFYYWNWNEGEPNNKGGTEYCVEMSADMLGQWNDINCDRKFAYICRKAATTFTMHPTAEPTRPPVTCSPPAALISGVHYVRDIAFSASSSGRPASNSRILASGVAGVVSGWQPDSGDSDPWIGVSFTHYVIVNGITTMGSGDHAEWVIDYRMSYKLQTGSFYDFYSNPSGVVEVFSGNTDPTTSKTNMLTYGTILAHRIRIYPGQFNGARSMRFELLGCKWETCVPQMLVTGDSMVPDARMKASSQWDDNHNPTRARLHTIAVNDTSYRGGWVPYPFDTNQWIQVEFDTTMAIYAVITQGREDYPQWTALYKLLYTDVIPADGIPNWETYQEPYGTDKVFTGNTDSNTLVTNNLAANVYNVRFLRINPQFWSDYGISLRFDILGCSSHREGCTDVPLIRSATDGIPDSALTSFTFYDASSHPVNSRLNSNSGAGAWVPLVNDPDQWIQADLGRINLIMAVATQGRADLNYEHYVTTYKLSASDDGNVFNTYPFGTEAKTFEGNWEQTIVHKYYLDSSFSARYVRLLPVTWVNQIAIRWEIYACAGWAAPSEIGCYADQSDNRDLQGPSIMMTPEGMTREACVTFCQSQTHLYAGVQLGEQCYCGNAYGRYGVSNTCNIPCRGDPSGLSTCGGTSANTILHTGIFSPDRVLGCFSDNLIRDLPYGQYIDVPGGNTQEYCAMHCFDLGYRFAGAQNARECYCGNSYGSYGPSSNCDMLCPGDRTGKTYCGGGWANTVISTGLADDHPRCRDGWTPFGSTCYLFVTQRVSWNQAWSACKALQADLATINYESVNNFVYAKAAELKTELWFGLHCLRQNNFFQWTSGAPILFTRWARREPNSASVDENCVMMYQNGYWNDDPCSGPDESKMYGYVCDMPKQNFPNEPTPTPDPSCPPGWFAYRWKCFVAIKTINWNWELAKSQCQGMDASLVRIEDGSEQAAVTSGLGLTSGIYWTDLVETDGLFRFTNGQAPTFTHWGQNQPEALGENGCVVINMNEHGLWNNIRCGLDYNVMSICERPRQDWTRPTIGPTNPGTGSCSTGWVASVNNQHCFLISAQTVSMRKTWVEAWATCLMMGADLVSIHSAEENSQLRIYIEGKSGDFWIGFNARDNSQGFSWSDGTTADFNRFLDSSKEDGLDCVDMYSTTATWNKIACDSKRNWICKIQKGLVPAVTTTVAPPTAGPAGSCSPDSDDWKFFQNRCYLFTGRFLPQLVQSEEDALTNQLEIENNNSANADVKRSMSEDPFAMVPDTLETNWFDAESYCRGHGGHLASIHTEEENRFIVGQLSSLNVQAYNVWLGMSDMNAMGSWQWSDDTPFDYRHWEDGQPDDQGGLELCGSMEINSVAYGTWSDKHCQNTYPVICTKPKGGVTITTPTPTPAPGYCPRGYLTYGDKCFKFYDEKVSWATALDRCKATVPSPYSLVTMSNRWDLAFISSQMRSRTISKYWIGMYQYHGNNGEFGWVDNTHLSFTNWARGEPNGGLEEACVDMYSEVDPPRSGLWNDERCGREEFGFICQRLKDPALSSPPDSPPANPCPSGYSVWEENCYRIDSSTRNWRDAESECIKDGGHLVDVYDRAEQAYITTLAHDANTDLWIGLSDQINPGRYVWVVDSTSPLHTMWANDMPKIRDGGCARLEYNSYGLWADSKCDAVYSSICKITRVPPPIGRPPFTGGCPGDNPWVEFGEHCYLFRPQDQVSAATAEHACMLAGSHLTSIHSDEENKFILDTYRILTPDSRRWIGLIKTADGGFMWTDGSAVGYLNWAEGEPNDDDRTQEEDCTEMWGDGEWNDIKCTNNYGYICKRYQLPAEGQSPPTTPPPVVSTTTGTSGTTQSTTTRSTTSPVTGPTPPTTPPIIIPPATRPVVGSEPLSSSGIVGVVFGCLVIAMVVVFAGLIYLKRRGTLAALDNKQGFDNPSYHRSTTSVSTSGGRGAEANPAFNNNEGVVNFGSDNLA